MLSDRIGLLLKNARLLRGLSRAQLAKRGKVSVRLVAELERGERPNVSLESALTLLNIVGLSIVAKHTDTQGATGKTLERAERTQLRRRTWTGRQTVLHAEDDDPRAGRSASARLSAVAEISQQAYAVALAGRRLTGARTKGQSSR